MSLHVNSGLLKNSKRIIIVKLTSKSKYVIPTLNDKKNNCQKGSTYFASKAKANTPAASGAAADVPLCDLVHFPYKSVVA
jgi:hypothetical protein